MKKNVLFLVIPLLLGCFLAMAQTTSEEKETPHDKIIERVTVQNMVVPVRVFDGNKPVGGLTQKDFQLFVNGKRLEINGFYEQRKKLESSLAPISAQETPKEVRDKLFVLVFNLNDYHQDLKGLLEVFFKDIIKPGDSLIVVYNHFFFPETKLVDVEKTKTQILKVLEKETKALKSNLSWVQSELQNIIATTKFRLSDSGEQMNTDFPLQIYRDFFHDYRLVLEELKANYFQLPVERYIRIAAYLKSQDRDKWVLNFFQVGQLPLLDSLGRIQKTLDSYMGVGRGRNRDLFTMYINYLNAINEAENIMLPDIGKLFLDSGATFHSMLLKPVNPGFSNEISFKSVSSDAETLLKNISQQTGGSVLRSNDITHFSKLVTTSEDIVYVLSYVSDPQAKNTDLKITPVNKNFHAVYDDQTRIKPFENTVKKLELESSTMIIENINHKAPFLMVQLSHIKLVPQETGELGALQVKVKVLDTQYKMVTSFEKSYQSRKKEGFFQIQLPPLEKGNYHVVLEIKDLSSLDNRLVGDAISITQN